MVRPSRLVLLVATAGALALPAAASAGTAPPPTDCPLWVPHAVEHAILGTDLVARDPYGGRLARNGLFFDFSVRGPKADLAKVANVQWSLDGTVVRTDDRAPFEWKGLSGSSKRMPAGDHTIAVAVTPTGGGTPATTSFALTATDCQPAGFDAFLPRGRGTATFTFQSTLDGGVAPDLPGLSVTRTANVKVSLPRALRGHTIGTLTAGKKTYTLKGATTALSAHGITARFSPGAQRFLTVTGLPAGVTTANVKLVPRVVALRSAKQPYRVTGTVRSGDAHASIVSGGRYV